MDAPRGLQGSHRQSNDFDRPRSSTYVGQLLQSAYWSLKLNDIVVFTAHGWEGALSQLGLNRGGSRGHMTICVEDASAVFPCVGWYCLVQHRRFNNWYFVECVDCCKHIMQGATGISFFFRQSSVVWKWWLNLSYKKYLFQVPLQTHLKISWYDMTYILFSMVALYEKFKKKL